MTEYVACPNCDGSIITAKYKGMFGQCKDCYERREVPLGVRIQQALR